MHNVPDHHQTRLYRGKHAVLLTPTHTRTSGMPMQQASPNCRAHPACMPLIHHHASHASHFKWPPPTSHTTFQPSKAHYIAAEVFRGNRCLHEAVYGMGAGLRHKHHVAHLKTRYRHFPVTHMTTTLRHPIITHSQPVLAHCFYHTCLSIICTVM